MEKRFQLKASYQPAGSQPAAIEQLVEGLEQGLSSQTLLGVTGSGKTFTLANVIERVQRPALVLAPNKTLAAQLYAEMKAFFPENAVEYFVSYYDYYQPEAYVPASDTFIEKDSAVNEQIEQMRLSATKALLSRRDVVIVASVSAIYGLGDPDSYLKMLLHLSQGELIDAKSIALRLTALQYQRNDIDFSRGTFRIRGDIVDIFPADSDRLALRVELFDDQIERLSQFDPLTGAIDKRVARATIYPKTHYVTPREELMRAVDAIKDELRSRLDEFRTQGKLLEAERLEQRTRYDLEMMLELGFCSGIENYSRHLSGRQPGEPPPTLFDYLPADGLLLVDESHVTLPQIGGMYRGDRSRKETLVNYGFRLPSALDNRPMKFEEFEALMPQSIFVSATPGPYEGEHAQAVVEQLVRPTGLLDPEVSIRPVATQVDDLLSEIRRCLSQNERVLITTLTKKMAEDLTEYYLEQGLKVRYLHSDIDTVERVEIIRDLRLGVVDVLIGINLLREGLDMPEVALVAILDADKEGFLRSFRSLIQTMGRAARNLNGRVILYADKETDSIRQALAETGRRRQMQQEFNQKHGITPRSTQRSLDELTAAAVPAAEPEARFPAVFTAEQYRRERKKLEKQMRAHAEQLEFEQAAAVRDQLKQLDLYGLSL